MKVAILFCGTKGAGPVFTQMLFEELCNYSSVDVFLNSGIDNREKWKFFEEKNDIIYLPSTVGFLNRILWFYKILFHKSAHKVYDVVIIPMLSPVDLFGLRLLRYKELSVFWHDVRMHPGDNLLVRFLGLIVIFLSSNLYVLNKISYRELNASFFFRKKKIFYFPHPVLPVTGFDQRGVSRNDEGCVNFMFFGRISEYKGLNILFDAFKIVESVEVYVDYRLIVMGSGDVSVYKDKIEALKRLTLINEWIPEDQIALELTRENPVVILPYTSATQSGIIPLCLGLGVPLIVSDLENLREQTKECAVFFESGNSISLADIIIGILTKVVKVDLMASKGREIAEELEPRRVVAEYLVPNLKGNP